MNDPGMKKWFLILITNLIVSALFATHQRSGEITYIHISGLIYEFTIITYTFAPSPADRPELDIKWGDGTTSTLQRVNGPPGYNPAGIWVAHVGEIVGPNIRKNVYIGRHTYPGASTYIVSLEDPNRNAGVINIPNSVDVPFYIETILTINPLLGKNNSPQLLLPPIDNACVGYPFMHNTGAFDPDGDSLSFKLVTCKGLNGNPIPGYTIPTASTSLTVDPISGELRWINPTMLGEYNLAILVEEWRMGRKIGSVVRDLQVIVGTCDNNPNPPVLNVPDYFCVVAGETLTFKVKASDKDGNVITLTGTGQPLLLTTSPAIFPQPTDSANHVTSTFFWPTTCEHIKKAPYQMFFKAQDNGTPVRLIDVKTVNILVIAPAPKDLTATPVGNSFKLMWRKSLCNKANGYKVFRKAGASSFLPGNCITGVPSSTGFQLIKTLNSINDTLFTDTGSGLAFIPGMEYCYLVTAIFPDDSESYASNQACASPKRDLPIITNTSVTNTSTTQGTVLVMWSKPKELDLIQTPGPFRYRIRRALAAQGNFQVIDSLSGLNDTIYIDRNLNTSSGAYTYIIDLINDTPGNRFLVGSSQPATTMFLIIAPQDSKLNLTWNVNVPWPNNEYTIQRLNSQSLVFDSIGTSKTPAFSDTQVTNGVNYCYKIHSRGSYPVAGLVSPILNFSQEKCASPKDVTPPCAPYLWVKTDCDQLANLLTWTNTNKYCPNTNDTRKYYIWYRISPASDFKVIDSTLSAADTSYVHRVKITISGCYSITSFDDKNNMSEFSNEVCVALDACPQYRLPNVFTPNGDNYNDLWIPFPFSGVEKVNLKVFNRWGRMVFETNDPHVNWDGKNSATNQNCPDGVYFYVCEVFEAASEGLRQRTINGSVHILR